MVDRQACKHKRVEAHPYRRWPQRRWIYFTCLDCALEWTESAIVADLRDVVTADEIIEVHQVLATGKTLGELLEVILLIEP